MARLAPHSKPYMLNNWHMPRTLFLSGRAETKRQLPTLLCSRGTTKKTPCLPTKQCLLKSRWQTATKPDKPKQTFLLKPRCFHLKIFQYLKPRVSPANSGSLSSRGFVVLFGRVPLTPTARSPSTRLEAPATQLRVRGARG